MSILIAILGIEVLPMPDLARVNSICRWGNKLYVAGEGGVGIVFLSYPPRLEHAIATEKPALLAAPDPTNGDVYFISGGWLWRWYPGTPQPFMLSQAEARSLGVGMRFLYLDGEAYSKGGFPTSGDPSVDGVVWVGERVNARRGDSTTLFLTPYYLPTFEMGNVEMRVFYPDMRDLWVGTWGRGIYRYRAETWMLAESVCVSPPMRRIYAIAGDTSGVWAIGDSGASRFSRGFWLTYTAKGRLFWCGGGEALAVKDTLVFLGMTCGLMRKKGESFILTRTGRPVRSVALDGERLWVGTEGGLFLGTLSANELSEISGSSALRINEILVGSWGTLALTDAGVYLVSESLTVSRLEDPRSFLSGEAYAGFVLGDTAFIVGNGGLALWNGGDWNYMSLPFSPISQRVRGAGASSDYIAIATENGAYFLDRKRDRWDRITTFHGLPSDFCWDVLLMGDSAYVATERGLAKVYLKR
ncbi:MAG: hypothetical protein ABIM74_06000 [candidate division WOR-3 bacterium]